MGQTINLDKQPTPFLPEPNMDKTRPRDGLNSIDKGCTCKEVFLKKWTAGPWQIALPADLSHYWTKLTSP
jgi:hypothetical protein